MTILKVIQGPHPILSKFAEEIQNFNEETKTDLNNLLETLRYYQAIGIAAPMTGLLKRLVAIEVKEEEKPLLMVNPEIISKSEEMQEFEEGSLCFPTISAMITRSKNIEVKYLDEENNVQQRAFTGFLSTVIQHEIDYLNGKIFLDYLTPLKRNMLIKKMQKNIKNHSHHVHTSDCNH